MPDLIPRPALDAAPLTLAGLTLAHFDPGPVHSVSPFAGKAKALGKALKPLAFPDPGQVIAKGAHRIVWAGRDLAFLFGDLPEGLGEVAAVTDQSGWAALRLTGPRAAQALMRLVPVDLEAMAPGTCARAPLNHLPALLIRTGDGFEILVFRSMARTAWHEIETVLRALAARDALC